jgi:RHH-type proline utilization regulon transcriptional repressor/proline dehydrogenase/delta 1-pyrroline-5-carboxylate dehydrogenase
MTNMSTESDVNTGSAAEHAPVSEGSPVLEAAALAEETIGLVRRWLTEAAKVPVDASAEQLAGVLKDPNGLDFTVGFVDGVVRPEDLQVAARNLAALAPKVPAFLPWYMRSAVRLGGAMAPALPQVVIPVARRVLREMVGHLIVDATDAKLGPAIAKIRKDGIKLNVNLLGEAVLGEHEASRRLEGTHKLLSRPDVDYVSIKVSSTVAPHSAWAFDEAVEHVVEKLTPLFTRAASFAGGGQTAKFIYLDMEEYTDPGQAGVQGPRGRHCAAGLPPRRARRHDPAPGLGRRPPRRRRRRDQGPRRQGRQPADGTGRSVPA